jgi:antitoxin HicB
MRLTMFSYPITLTPDKQDGGFVVTFKDIPEAITQGDSLEDALSAAQEALETALDFYFDDRRAVPYPSKPKRGQNVAALSASMSAKVLLLNEMVNQDIRPAELARRLGTTPQEVNRLTNVRHTSRIDGIAAALQVLGKQLEMKAV